MVEAHEEAAIAALDGARGVGVLVPPANPVIEAELSRLLPPSVRLHVMRLPVMPGTTLQERNRRYPGTYAAALDGFGNLALEAAVVGLTGPCYPLLPPGDDALAAALSRPGRPVQTASGAIRDALAALGLRRLCLVSPYPQWLTDEAAAYWQAAGCEVVQVVKPWDAASAYELTGAQVRAALQALQPAMRGAEAVVMSGTGMLTLPAILAVRAGFAVPILSSNICCAWWLLRTLGMAGKPDVVPVLAAVAPELAAAA